MSEASWRTARVRLIKFGFGAIALLAVLGIFAFINANPRHHGRPTSLATAIAIEMAVNSFYTEYGAMPDVGSRVRTDTPEGIKLLTILLGLEKTDKPQNPREIKFLSVREGKDRRNGLIYSAAGNMPEGLFDQWGNPYTVELDVQYKEQLHFNVASSSVDLEGRSVAAYSPGEDKKLGTADDVTNW